MSFPDSQQVYHQLKWDSRFSLDACAIVLTDRDSDTGTKTVAFRDFIPGGAIPWHRVIRFVYAGNTLWDRSAKVDRRAQLASVLTAGVAPAATRADSTALPTYRFIDGQWAVDTRGASSTPKSFATWNVLFDVYDAELLDSERRWPLLLETVRRCDADVLVFTEATPRFVELVLAQPWVRLAYASSGLRSSPHHAPHGVLLLARGGLSDLHAVRLEETRRAALCARVGQSVVSAVHLKSDRRGSAANERSRDCARVFAHVRALAANEGAFIIGDFNAGHGELEPQFEEASAVDAWASVHPDDAGLTYDPARNALAAVLTSSGRRGRLDRVVQLGHSQRFTSARLLGETPVDGLTLSDHFGLVVELELDEARLAAAPTGHRSAVVLVPPVELWGPIQQVRARLDADRFLRWMPHLTLLSGFLESELLSSAARLLREVVAGLDELALVFDEVVTFEHRASTTLALSLSPASARQVVSLQQRLQATFPQCVEQNRGAANTYMPHLTLGSIARNTEVSQVLGGFRAHLPLRGSVSEVVVLHRPADLFVIAHRAPFSTHPSPVLTAQAPARDVLLEAVNELSVPGQLECFGSARYAPASKSEEVDALCIIEANADVEQVVTSLEASLARRDVVTRRASPTLLRATGYDVQVAQLPPALSLRPLGRWVEDLTDGALRRMLLGPLDAEALRETLERHGRAAAFDELFPVVRAWSKARGLEGNAFGYCGGLGWAVLTAAPLLHDEQLCAQATWKKWCVWAAGLHASALVCLDLGASLPGTTLRLCSPARPFRDIARSMTDTTRAVLLREFARLGREQTFEDVAAHLGPHLVFSGEGEATLGRFQQRFLSLCSALEPSIALRPVGRVDRFAGRWQVLLGASAEPPSSFAHELGGDVTLEWVTG